MRERYNNFLLRKCTMSDIDRIYNLQTDVIDGLDKKSILRKNSRNMFERCMQPPNLTIGVFDSTDLVALAIWVDERGNEEDLSLDLVNHSAKKSSNFKLVMVKQEYRGNGFQAALMWILEKYAYNQGFTHLCTTVSSENIYSLNNIKKAGYEYDHSAIKYEGLSREVYIKDIYRSVSLYNKMMLNTIASLENKTEPNALIMEGINFDKCFAGEISIATIGDVLEYEDLDSGKIYYGLYIRKVTPMVLIYSLEKGSLQVVDFSYEIFNLSLKKVWINSVGGV